VPPAPASLDFDAALTAATALSALPPAWLWAANWAALSLVAGAIAAAASAAMRSASPAARQSVHRAALAAALLSPLAAALPVGFGPRLTVAERPAPPVPSESIAPAPSVEWVETVAEPVGRSPILRPKTFEPITVALTVLTAGTLLLLTRTALSAWGLSRLVRGSRPVEDAETLTRLDEAAERLGLSVRPGLRLTACLESPAAAGVWRPVVLLPESSAGSCDSAVLAHELAHHRRRDPLWNLLSALACAVCWWNPLVWWSARRQRVEAEYVCDEAAARAVGDGLGLAGHLAALAEAKAATDTSDGPAFTPAGVALAAHMAAFRSELGRRVERLLSLEPGSAGRVALRAATVPAVAAAVALALACPRLGESAPPPSDAAPSPAAAADGGGPVTVEVEWSDLPAAAPRFPIPPMPPERTSPRDRLMLFSVPATPPGAAVPLFGTVESRDVFVRRVERLPQGASRPVEVAVRAVFVKDIDCRTAAETLSAEPRWGGRLRIAADADLAVIALRGPPELVGEAERRLREWDLAGRVPPALPAPR
jgi:beta-lactamase regulating signal transducer with metallopeptidase domain